MASRRRDTSSPATTAIASDASARVAVSDSECKKNKKTQERLHNPATQTQVTFFAYLSREGLHPHQPCVLQTFANVFFLKTQYKIKLL